METEQSSPAGTRPRRWPRVVLLFAVAALATTGCVVQAVFGSSLGNSTVDDGRRLYQEQCASCHGQRGDRIPASPLSSKEFLESRRDATLVASISAGRGVMPAFGKAREGPLSDDQIRAVVAYMNQTAGRSSATLLAGQGRAIYQEQCTRCHGDKGDRVPVAPLSSKAFIDSRSEGQLVEAVGEGVGVMPGFRQGQRSTLSDEQVRAVVSYLQHNVQSLLAERVGRGRDLYVNQCLTCHGERGDRSSGQALASPDDLRKLGDNTIASAISDGKGKMPGFVRAKGGTLSTEDVGALLAYLKSWAGLPADIALEGTGGGAPAAASGAAAAASGGGAVLAKGKELYSKDCTACHGDKGDKLPMAKLNDGAWLQQRGDTVLTQGIAVGKGAMPGFGKDKGGPLSQDDVAAILAHLKSLAGLAPAPAAAPQTAAAAEAAAPAAAGNAAQGKELFAKSCAACHGDKGDKLGMAKLNDGAWLQQRGDTTLTQGIAVGKGAMPGFGKEKGGPLSADDVAALLAHMKSLAGLPAAPAAPAAAAAAAPAAAAPAAAAPAAAAPASQAAASKPAGALASALQHSPSDEALVARGGDLYRKNCTSCHGDTRAKMGKLADGDWLQQRGDRVMARAIADGKSLPGARDAMPGYGKEKGGAFSPDDITAVIGYLKSVAGIPLTAPPLAAGAGGADVAFGKELFAKSCTACHGDKGDKLPVAKLDDGTWLQQKGDAGLTQGIVVGKGAMPGFGKDKGGPLSADDVAAVIAYLKSLAGLGPASS